MAGMFDWRRCDPVPSKAMSLAQRSRHSSSTGADRRGAQAIDRIALRTELVRTEVAEVVSRISRTPTASRGAANLLTNQKLIQRYAGIYSGRRRASLPSRMRGR